MMKRFSTDCLLAAALLVGLLMPLPAHAASVVMCAPPSVSAAKGPKFVTNPATGGGSYSLDQNGCAVMVQADVGYFRSQGYSQGGGLATLFLQTPVNVAPNGATVVTGVLPPAAYITDLTIQEMSGAAPGTSSFNIGTSSGGTQIVNGTGCAALCLTAMPDVSMAKRVFNSTNPQTMFVSPSTNWGGSQVNVTIHYTYF